MQIDLLDVGQTKYGDCVLVRHRNRSVLIDGAHSGDSASIKAQLRRLFGKAAPFKIDLLVVTHCHSDHIGCLPQLTSQGDLVIETALVADEMLGWGRGPDGTASSDSRNLTEAERSLLAALQEEDVSDLPDVELEAFLAADATLEQQYSDMLQRLSDHGTKIVRFGRDPVADVQAIEEAFSSFGLRVLGPTVEQLGMCARAIADGTDALVDALQKVPLPADADSAAVADRYRVLAGQARDAVEFGADRVGVGAAKNDQSIVLKFAADGWTALLAGDMQFAKPEVSGLDPLMTALRKKVVEAGPYDFIKLTHHTSYNAVDDTVLDQWAGTRLYAHTGGRMDPSHPDAGALDRLAARADAITFARTDRNGIISVKKNGSVKMTKERGRFNDFSVNRVPDEPEPPAMVPTGFAERRRVVVSTQLRDGQGVVEVVARIPHESTKVTLTVEVEPGTGALTTRARDEVPPRRVGGGPDLKIGGGRVLPNLLFVTCKPSLERNIGQAETERVLRALRSVPTIRVLDLPAAATVDAASLLVRRSLQANPADGVVLLGGFDVVPADRLDVLDRAARQAVEAAGLDGQDADDFVVWSDDIYGDSSGDEDHLPDVPVSRIPDGRRADVVFAALQAHPFTAAGRFGIGNLNRPFAGKVFPAIPGAGGKLAVSAAFSPAEVRPGAATGAVYYMLHGSARDASRFWGEEQGGAAFEAFDLSGVPAQVDGTVVFTGCCWGALVMSPPAFRFGPDTVLQPRVPETSVAIAYLRAGAVAFVGCTGSHYSPLQPPYDYFGKPLHDAFWAAIGNGKAPAEALFLAKQAYVARMPHGRTDPFSRAVEVKIVRQFTCLGLGW